MLLYDKTLEKFGYTPYDLTSGSKKSVCLKCDYCEEEFEAQYKNRNNSYKKLPKDCCSKCKFKKREEVSLATHGVKNSAQRPEVRQKIADSGWIKSDEFAQKKKESMLEKYGVEHAIQCPEIQEKMRNTMNDRYGCDHSTKIPGLVERSVKKSNATKIRKGLILSINNKTLPEHAREIGLSRSFFGKLVKDRGFDAAVAHEKTTSSLETKISNYLDSIGIAYQKGVMIDRKKPDFVIGDLVIEVDGLRWHSDLFVETSYHSKKLKIYKENGYRALFFRSDEILEKFDIVTSIIRNALKINTNKIFARKCQIKEVGFAQRVEFLKKNHLMGNGPSSKSYGLYLGDELVSLLTLKRNNNNNWEISRFCNKLDTSVVGGFTRLLKYFTSQVGPMEIKTFIDLRYGTGSYLGELGFSKVSEHLSFKWTNGSKVYNRMKFPGSSGYENGLVKIWDCGQAKYVWCNFF